MLSLPLIAPPNEYILFLSPHLRPNALDSDNPSTNPQQQRRQPASQRTHTRSSLAQLVADEASIAQRKHNIRHFGSGWIKPPGVTKTLQAELEERAEREEQEAIARREQVLLDLQARQEVEEARVAAAEAAAREEAEGEQEERDLDDEIPDADEEEEEEEEEDDDDDDDDDDEDEEEDGEGSAYPETSEVEVVSVISGEIEEEGEVTFNDESLLEGSYMPGDEERDRIQEERYARLEEAELTGVAQDEADLGIEHERDLDESVPEASAYEHTDTELMTSSEGEEEDGSNDEVSAEQISEVRPTRRTSGRASTSLGRRESGRMSIPSAQSRRSLRERQVRTSGSERSLLSRDISSLLDSSFMASSPVMGRLRSGNNRGGR